MTDNAIPAPTAAALLDEAASLYATSRAGYRDAMIRVGDLLRRYVTARLREGDSLNEAGRARINLRRAACTADAAFSLATSRNKVNELMRISAAVELLAGSGGVGGLSYTSLRYFRVAIERVPVARVRRGLPTPSGTGRPTGAAGGLAPSGRNVWRVRQVRGIDPAAVFHRAALEGWDSKTVMAELRPLTGRRGGMCKAATADRRIPDFVDLARQGGPRDVADLAVEFIRASADPALVASLVAERLRQTLRPGLELSLADAGDDD
jgi:hypothetical protein